MNHRITGKKLGRNHNQRQALIKGLTRSMFTYGSIETTEAKAKSAVAMVEKAANVAMKDTLAARQELFKIFQDQNWVNRIVSQMKAVFGTQTSNFTKIKKLKRRYGDDALIVSYSFVKPVDFKAVEAEKSTEKKVTKPAAPKAAASDKAVVKKAPVKKAAPKKVTKKTEETK